MSHTNIRAININDLYFVADIHVNAFSDRALAALGLEAVRRYYEWQLLGPHDAIALGIFQDRHLAGFCFAGVFQGALSGFLQKNKKFLAGRVITHPWLIASPLFRHRIHLAWNVLMKRSVKTTSQPIIPQAKSFGILAIAIDPQVQGNGLGKKLMAEAERVAVARGFSKMHLTVNIHNDQAIAFYEKLGWQKLTSHDETWQVSMSKDLMYGCE